MAYTPEAPNASGRTAHCSPRRRCYVSEMKPTNVYRCPDGHETVAGALDPRLLRPKATALYCKERSASGKPCNKFALFLETRE
jgi:hypothetical protein